MGCGAYFLFSPLCVYADVTNAFPSLLYSVENLPVRLIWYFVQESNQMDFLRPWENDGFIYGILSLSPLQKPKGDIGRRLFSQVQLFSFSLFFFFSFSFFFYVAEHFDCYSRRNLSLHVSSSVTTDFVRTLLYLISFRSTRYFYVVSACVYVFNFRNKFNFRRKGECK